MIHEILFTVRVLAWLAAAVVIVLTMPYWVVAPTFGVLAKSATTLVGRRETERARPAPATKGVVDLTTH